VWSNRRFLERTWLVSNQFGARKTGKVRRFVPVDGLGKGNGRT
jgi:hypothetical protein